MNSRLFHCNCQTYAIRLSCGWCPPCLEGGERFDPISFTLKYETKVHESELLDSIRPELKKSDYFTLDKKDVTARFMNQDCPNTEEL